MHFCQHQRWLPEMSQCQKEGGARGGEMATPRERRAEFQKEYMASTKEKFQHILECKSHSMEAANMQRRDAHLRMLNQSLNMRDILHEIEHSGRHLCIMDEGSDRSSRTTLQALFDSYGNEAIQKVVVLQGVAGIGKTTTCEKILQEWASGKLYKDKFDFIFYLSCRVINNMCGNISIVGLLSGTCSLPCSDELVSLLKDSGSHSRLLFILDGFDELRWTLEEGVEVDQEDLFQETHKDGLLQNLLQKRILKQSSLIVTTRPEGMQRLGNFITDTRYVKVLGFNEEDLEEYLQNVFETKDDAEKALGIIKANDFLLDICAVPVLCRITCAALKPRIHMDVDSIGCKTITSVFLLYVEGLIKPHADKQVVRVCLKKLCALANEGILKRHNLFTEEDLERRELSLLEVESVFQKDLLFHRNSEIQTFYSFFHQTVQELLTALHYLLDDGDEISDPSLPEIFQGICFSSVYTFFKHFIFVLRFLFGLLNKATVEAFSERTGCNISLRAKPVLGEWLTEDTTFLYYTAAISCLYETQDEDFIRSTMSRSSCLKIQPELHGLLEISKNALQQLRYCLQLCEHVQSLTFCSIKMDPESLEMLSPVMQRCQQLSLDFCGVTPACCGVLSSILTKNRSLTKLHLSENPVEDCGVTALCEGLRDPACTLRELILYRCDLTPGCCEDLCSAFMTNRSLIKLDLSINDIESSGAKRLWEGLRHPGCTLQELSLRDCDLGSPCCDDLRSLLSINRTLIRLDLTQNPLEDIGVTVLCEALRDPACTLQDLRLSGCGLTSSCCEDLRSILVTNRSLTNLDLSNNDLTNSGIEVVCDGLTDPGSEQSEPRAELETTLVVGVNTRHPDAAGWMEALRQKGCRLLDYYPMSITYTRVR